jgi:GT2 family glycosyltransferase/glycosyltransferase involved in cell wall biosynthesis
MPVITARGVDPILQQHRIAVVVAVCGDTGYARRCLESVLESTRHLVPDVIVVDDCTPHGSMEVLDGLVGLRRLRNSQKLGYLGSCNRGAQEGEGDIVVFLNSDMICPPGWLDEIVEPLLLDPEVGLVAAKLTNSAGLLLEAGGVVWSNGNRDAFGKGRVSDEPEFNYRREIDACSGAGVAMRRGEFLALGKFETDLVSESLGEVDLSFKVNAIGKKIVYQPRAEIIRLERRGEENSLPQKDLLESITDRARFAEKWRAQLATHFAAGTNPELAVRRGRQRMLVVDKFVPQPDNDAGSVRMAALLECAQEVGFDVVFMDMEETKLDARARIPLQARGIQVLYRPWWKSPEEYLAIHGDEIDVVVLSRPDNFRQLYLAARRFAPRAFLVYDTVDLHFLRFGRELACDPSPKVQASFERYKAMETLAASSADLTYVVSDVEVPILQAEVPHASIRILSTIHSVRSPTPDFSRRADLLFIGGFQHDPNLDAVKYFVTSIFPLVRAQIPGINFNVVGSHPPPELLSMDVPGVKIHGYMESITEILDSSKLMVVPLRFGAGVKGKINTAMANGLPVVTTAIGAEGMGLVDGLDCRIADGEGAFAAAVVSLVRNDEQWSAIAKAGKEVINRNFSRQRAKDELSKLHLMSTGRFHTLPPISQREGS